MAHTVENESSPFRIGISLQKLKTSRNDSKKVIEVVRNSTGQLTHSFHFLSLTERLLGHRSLGDLLGHMLLKGSIQVSELFLRTLPVRNVARRPEPLEYLSRSIGDGDGA